MKLLLILAGLPGAGKSHFARRLAHPDTLLVIEEDAYREKLYGCSRPSSMKAVYEAMYEAASAFFSSHEQGTVILDAAHLMSRDRLAALDGISGYDMAGLLLFSTPLDVCKRRNGAREASRRVPEKVLAFMAPSYQGASIEEEKRFRFVYHYPRSGS